MADDAVCNSLPCNDSGSMPSDKRWAQQYYLGAEVASDELMEKIDISIDQNRSVRGAIYNSSEGKNHWHSPARPAGGTFYVWKNSQPKVVVLGNYQGPNLARAISLIAKAEVSICGLEIMEFSRNREKFLSDVKSADYIVVCKTYSEEFSDISFEKLNQLKPGRIYEYSPVYFSGLHPDICYLGARGERIYSAVGDYNSRIIANAFVCGRPEDEVERLFNAKVFEYAGYFDVFDNAKAEFMRREDALSSQSIKFGKEFFERIKSNPLLYSVNHPTSALLKIMAQAVCDALSIDTGDVVDALIANTLVDNVIWPVHKKIAEFHQLNYHTNNKISHNHTIITLSEFVWRNYQIYRTYDMALIKQSIDDSRLQIDFE